jgi:hypothetical protein
MKNPDPIQTPDPERPAPKKRDPLQPEKIDFTKLDLSIEKVEERITPSETNVFDK